MTIYRIQRKEENFFRYREIAGRFFIAEESVMEGKIPCMRGKIVFYGRDFPTVTLPNSVLEPIKEEHQKKIENALKCLSEYPSLIEAGKAAQQKITDFHQTAAKMDITDLTGIWYKDTLYYQIRNYLQEHNIKPDKDVFSLIGKIMYRHDLMIMALENISIIEDAILLS